MRLWMFPFRSTTDRRRYIGRIVDFQVVSQIQTIQTVQNTNHPEPTAAVGGHSDSSSDPVADEKF